MGLFLQDLHWALRPRPGRRGPVRAAVVILAVAIGASTAVFSVVHGLLLVPLPVEAPDRLVLLAKEDARRDFADFPVFSDEFSLWQGETEAFEALAAMAPEGLWAARFEDGGEPATLDAAPVTGGFFRVLGVNTVRGRPLMAEDSAPGAPRTVVLSHGFWQRRYGGAEDVLGRSVNLLGQPHRIVGVAPPGFEYPEGAQLWFSLGLPPAGAAVPKELVVIGRLAPGWDLPRAHAEIDTLSRRHRESGPEYLRQTRLTSMPWSESIVGPVRRPLWILFTAVLLLVAVASANVAHLLLVAARRRHRQLALRAALGAGRGTLARQQLAEGTAVALAGGVLGIGLAALGVRALVWLQPEALPRLDQVGLHPGVLAFAVGVTALATLLSSLLPALRATRADPATALRGATTTGGARDSRWLDGLVVTEVALALVLLVGAGLLSRSFLEVSQLERGFQAENLLSVRLALSRSETDDRLTFHRDLVRRLETLPGVLAATPALNRPLSESAGFDARVIAEGQSEEDGVENPWINYEAAAPESLETLGLPLLEGRFFTASDAADSRPVAVVNASLARYLWPDSRALGQRLRLAAPDAPWLTVVGVVGDTRYRELTRPRLSFYVPFSQSPFEPRYLLVRTSGDPAPWVPQIRRTIRERASGVPLDDITTVEAVYRAGLARPRFNALLMSLFALMAALVALVGIYAVMASRVTHRLRELGIRSALGASPQRLLHGILARGMGLASTGVLGGLAAALALSRYLESLLFEVEPLDPATFLGVTAVFLLVALLALLLPARRAARADPVEVLRS